ncbi:stalk domain-containing protein [Paenibacillus amylolyticus]|nr:stalk domain-containing protein [Paenibacillus amylolyticus]WFR65454.1 stalk domain-containing protein [Paenibacillus amylolyticus]
MKKVIVALSIGMLVGSSSMAVAATSQKVQATLANFKVIVNGQSKTVTSDQLLYKGNTYLQLREAAKILGYEVKYTSASRSIDFTAKSQNQANWINLIDFSASNGYQVALKEDSLDIYNITKNQKNILSVNANGLKENEEKVVTDTSGKTIRYKKLMGSLVLNREDLKRAGLI